jgi:hypothetical protein
LMKQGIVKEHSCPICGISRETMVHILLSCPSALNVWGVCGRKF